MHIMRPHRVWLALVVASIASITSASTGVTFAAGATGLPVVVRPCDASGNQLDGPGYFQVTAAAGSTTHLYALIGNKSSQKAVVSILPVDAATGINGGVTARSASQPQHLVGTWLHLSATRVSLGANRAQVIDVMLTVPKGIRAGQYVGALTAFVPARETRRGRGFVFTVQTRLADDVVVTVPGPQSWQFRPMGVSVQRRTVGTYVIAHIKNTGTMLLKGWGYFWLWQPGRQNPVLAVPLHLDTTLPHTTATYPLLLAKHPSPGHYAFTLKVWWNGGHMLQHGSVQVH